MRTSHAKQRKEPTKTALKGIAKKPTGINGFDEITGGGLPAGRPTLICGGAGSGKTVFGVEFLSNGALRFGEPGVLVTFEEQADEVAQNVASFGIDFAALEKKGLLVVEHIHVARSEIEETGEYNLEGLFIRLGAAIDSVGAKRIVLDTIESLFSGFSNAAILRAELRRLFQWLKTKGVTAVITSERDQHGEVKQDLEEYVSDCVVYLDNRVHEQVTTRRLRVVKYRGSRHGVDEYPFLIDEHGISVLPLSSLSFDHPVSTERVSSGIPRLDEMLEGKGYFRASSVLVTGKAGTGKSSLAAHFAESTCRRGERCLYFMFEESTQQLLRDTRSIGLDLATPYERGQLRVEAARPSVFGLEMHLVRIHQLVEEFAPSTVIVDPISTFMGSGAYVNVQGMMVRIIDFLRGKGITAIFTCLSHAKGLEETEVGISSIIDTWIQLRDFEMRGERTHGLYILKSRGMGHSNQVREFQISSHGIQLVDIQLGPEGVLTGSARIAQAAQDDAARLLREQEFERRMRALDRKRKAMEAQIAMLQADFSAEEHDLLRSMNEAQQREQREREDRAALMRRRDGLPVVAAAADAGPSPSPSAKKPRAPATRRKA